MKMLSRAALTLLTLSLCAPLKAAPADGMPLTQAQGLVTTQAIAIDDGTGHAKTVSKVNPDPVAITLNAAGSTAQQGSVTPSTATATSGTVAISAGVATIGPITPELGRPLRVVLKGVWTGSFSVGTSVNACSTINPLTIGGLAWASFTGDADEAVDVPTVNGVTYCATAIITSGALTYAVRQ